MCETILAQGAPAMRPEPPNAQRASYAPGFAGRPERQLCANTRWPLFEQLPSISFRTLPYHDNNDNAIHSSCLAQFTEAEKGKPEMVVLARTMEVTGPGGSGSGQWILQTLAQSM